jgi:hypothetical protein
VTSLDVEYSGGFGVDILRQMEAKADLCSSGLIIGQRRYALAGLNNQDCGAPPVTVAKPVSKGEWSVSGLINPAGSTRNGKVTGEPGVGGLTSLDGRELNPDGPANYENPHDTMSVVLAHMVTLPPKL